MQPVLLLIVYCVLIVVVSLLGGFLPRLMRLTHTRMQLMMSLVGGLMLGVGLLHLLPHAVAMIGDLDWAVMSALVGLLFMFALIRVFHVHQHATLEDAMGHGKPPACAHDHEHDHDHHHPDHHHHGHAHHHSPGPAYGWVGLAFGLALHTLIDGIALGATVASEALLHGGGGRSLGLLGLGTFLAVLLHKPLDAMAITTLMQAGKWSPRAIAWINFAFSLMCPLGAALFYFGVDFLGPQQSLVVGTALAFAGGVFLCISLADILPEVSFHSHDRLGLTSALLAGVLLAVGIGFLEPEHAHHHGGEGTGHQHNGHHH